MFVGAKHDRSEYKMITNNLSAVMLRPLQKLDAPNFPLMPIQFILPSLASFGISFWHQTSQFQLTDYPLPITHYQFLFFQFSNAL
jgi:hypothetical protein